jgi:Resolvase, N terminal domain
MERKMIIGYARVSTDGQSLESQDASLRATGAERLYAEKVRGADRYVRNAELFKDHAGRRCCNSRESSPDRYGRTISMTVMKVPLRSRATSSESSKFLRTLVQPI